MDYYKERYEAVKNIFKDDQNFSWNLTDSGKLVLYQNSIPFGVFKVKKIATIYKKKWIWCWKERHNYIDKKMYPSGLHKKAKDWKKSKDNLEKIVKSMEALKGFWYLYLVESPKLTNIVIITKVVKLY